MRERGEHQLEGWLKREHLIVYLGRERQQREHEFTQGRQAAVSKALG